METNLTKRDVARRQLTTAISLFFDDKDLVSIHSLATNAWEVIDVLCNEAGVTSFSNQTRANIPVGRDLKVNYINVPYRNFFKHADRDPSAVLAEFDPKAVEAVMFLAVEDYIRLFKKSPIQLQTFQVWYLATNDGKIDALHRDRVLLATNHLFPDISTATRAEQLRMGRSVLETALLDPELLKDERTE